MGRGAALGEAERRHEEERGWSDGHERKTADATEEDIFANMSHGLIRRLAGVELRATTKVVYLASDGENYLR